MPTCPIHPTVNLRCPACEGARGGASKSEAQNAARAKNAKKGGWPKGRKRKAVSVSLGSIDFNLSPHQCAADLLMYKDSYPRDEVKKEEVRISAPEAPAPETTKGRKRKPSGTTPPARGEISITAIRGELPPFEWEF